MAEVYNNANEAAAKHKDTRSALRKENDGVRRRAVTNLEQANKTSRITKDGYFPAEIETSERDVDFYTTLVAPNAVALEFGHDPSGAFGPGGRYYGRQKAPTDPEYILTRAAIGGSPS